MITIMWFREDLRLFDNPALSIAAKQGQVLPIFFYPKGLGGASYWWLHHSLVKLSASLAEQGLRLILSVKDPEIELPRLAELISAKKVVWNRVYSPSGVDEGRVLKQALGDLEIACQSFNAQLLTEPSKITTKQGTPYKVFTAFWRLCLQTLEPDQPLAVPTLEGSDVANLGVVSDSLEDWDLLPTNPDWSGGLAERWQPGEWGAADRLERFLECGIDDYQYKRDFPSADSTSYLSPYLTFGEISVRHIWHQVHQSLALREVSQANADKFLAELGWREFSRYLILNFPHMLSDSFNPKFDLFPWQQNPELLRAWQQGRTGYPIIDAGMRELWHTGYMHNRVRMLVASFLCKHCLIHWREGMNWFWDTLVDADIGSNTASWQWVSGSGADASPYFRIFNPIVQGDKFDREGVYIKRWVPELADLPKKFINTPWLADTDCLKATGVSLGNNYPFPIVDHKESREQALLAYQFIRLNSN
jgi:deoxyribodipyrimidine photo-lyase